MKRRTFLTAVAGVGVTSLSGCLDSLPAPLGGPSVEQVKNNAESIPYNDLYRNIESHNGGYVHYTGANITDIPSATDTKEYLLSLPGGGYNDSRIIWGVWTGSPFRENDNVELWGVVQGLTEYNSLSGKQTVPKIEIVDMELV